MDVLELEQQDIEALTPAQLAGRKGGQATARTHGHSFYQQIGSKSGGKFVAGGFRAKDVTRRQTP